MAPTITFTAAGVDVTIVAWSRASRGEEQRDDGHPQEAAPLGPPRGAGRGRRADDGRRGVLARRLRLRGVAPGRLGLRPVRSPVLGPEAAGGGITEVRQEGRETRSSVQQLSQEVEAIRAQTAATLDDLREVTLEHLRQRRETDEDAFRRFREDPTFENVTRLLDRARQLGGISQRGVRVRLPGTDFRLRFPVPAEDRKST